MHTRSKRTTEEGIQTSAEVNHSTSNTLWRKCAVFMWRVVSPQHLPLQKPSYVIQLDWVYIEVFVGSVLILVWKWSGIWSWVYTNLVLDIKNACCSVYVTEGNTDSETDYPHLPDFVHANMKNAAECFSFSTAWKQCLRIVIFNETCASQAVRNVISCHNLLLLALPTYGVD